MKTCVATGGGIVSEKKNWGKLQTGMVVWLDMEVRTSQRGLFEEFRAPRRSACKFGKPILHFFAEGRLVFVLSKSCSIYSRLPAIFATTASASLPKLPAGMFV